MRRRVVLQCAGLALAGLRSSARGDETLAGIACRSVHLNYPAPAGIAFFNEATVVRSAPGTYFCAIGWNKGYFGIQEPGRGRKVVIFSVWDSAQNDKEAVDESRRVKLLHQGDGVRIGRFGGEGTGGQSFLDHDWKVGATYRFLVAAKVAGERTEYAGFFSAPEDGAWRHLVTFSTIAGGKELGGYYSFVEDFRRDKVSATKPREARFGNAWVKASGGDWRPIARAKFTADRNPSTAIDASIADGRFVLATGGDTQNEGTTLGATLDLPDGGDRKPPEGLPDIPGR